MAQVGSHRGLTPPAVAVHATSAAHSQILALDGIRGVAILLVLCYHLARSLAAEFDFVNRFHLRQCTAFVGIRPDNCPDHSHGPEIDDLRHVHRDPLQKGKLVGIGKPVGKLGLRIAAKQHGTLIAQTRFNGGTHHADRSDGGNAQRKTGQKHPKSL